MEPRRSLIGEMLVRRAVLTHARVEEALELQARSGNRLATECFRRGFAPEQALLGPLSAQAGVPGVTLARLVLPLHILGSLPESLLVRELVLPIRVDPQRIFVALADPADETLLGEVAFLAKRQAIPCVALHGPLRETVTAALSAKGRGELEYRGPEASDKDAVSPFDFLCVHELSMVPEAFSASISGSFEQSAAESDPVVELDPSGAEVDGEVEVVSGAYDLGTMEERRPAPAKGGTGPRVLVVEDDEKLLQLVSRLLTGKGLQVVTSKRGLEALGLVKSQPPDLMILDAMLPEVHGFDIARKVKSSDRYGHIPIIMVSSVYRGWRIARDLKESYGVDAFLEKPFGIADLWKTVERLLAEGRRPVNERQMAASAERAFRAGMQAYREGDLDRAIECLVEGLRIDPLSPKLHFQLGVLYLKKRGMIYQAIFEFEEAVTLEPEMFVALRSLAILFQQKGFRNKAIDMWERALQCSPDAEVRERIRRQLVQLIGVGK